MKNRKTRIALLFTLCLLLASLVTVLLATAQGTPAADSVTVAYADGTEETFALGETIVPIPVPKDFARRNESGDAYVYTVSEGADWSFTLDGKALGGMTVTEQMLGKTVVADIVGTFGTEKVWYTVHESIVDETVPEKMRGEFLIYGYDQESLITYLSRSNTGGEEFVKEFGEPRYRFLRQIDNVFRIKLYEDFSPAKFDPRWGAASKDWELPNESGTAMVMCQDRTFRGTYDQDGNPKCVGTSASVYFDLNGQTLEIGSSESFHFGSMACTPYSMRLWFYSSVPGGVFSGTKSEAVFYSDDDSTVYVGEPDGDTVRYGQNLSVYGKRVAHVNYGGGVYLWGGRYYQAGPNPEFITVSHRLHEIKNCEFYLADQSGAVILFEGGRMSGWKNESQSHSSNPKFVNCSFHVNQQGTKLFNELQLRDNNGKETAAVDQAVKYPLRFVDCEFYGIPVKQYGAYLFCSFTGETAFSVGTDENFGTIDAPAYISYLKAPTKTRTLIDDLGNPFTVAAICAIRPASEVACIQHVEDNKTHSTYWESGATPFVQDKTVITATERYVETEGEYLGLPEVLAAGQTYVAKGVFYNKRVPFAFIYTMSNGSEGYGLVGNTPEETGRGFAQKFGSLSEGSITLLTDIVLSQNVDFGTKGKVALDMNGYCITVAENATVTGAVHRIGDKMEFFLYSSRPGAVYENLSDYPIFSLAHVGRSGKLTLGDYTTKNGETYSGANITYISKGSFFLGYPMAEGATDVAELRAKNCTFIYKGNGAAFLLSNAAVLEYAKIVFEPETAGVIPVAIGTQSHVAASAAIGSCSFYAGEGVSARAFGCFNSEGVPVNTATAEQVVNFGNCSFFGVEAEKNPEIGGVQITFGTTGFSTMEMLAKFYGIDVPAGQALVRSSAQFYKDGKLVYLPVWAYAKPDDTAKVSFLGGASGAETIEETWIRGSMACQPDFVVDGIFVFTYGRRLVEASNNRLTAACVSLAPGAMRVNLSLVAQPKLNLWIPMDSPITEITVGGKTVAIGTALDYKGSYYIVQTPITPAMLAGSLELTVKTASRSERVMLNLLNYINGLLESQSVSAEEKKLLYALVDFAEVAAGETLPVAAPQGYVSHAPKAEEAPSFGGALSGASFEYNSGVVLKVSGTAGKTVVLETADGERRAATLEGGTAVFADLPLYSLAGEITLTVGSESYTYSLGAYRAEVAAAVRPFADAMYTVAYYAQQWYASKGE